MQMARKNEWGGVGGIAEQTPSLSTNITTFLLRRWRYFGTIWLRRHEDLVPPLPAVVCSPRPVDEVAPQTFSLRPPLHAPQTYVIQE